jgi:D-alanyl-D-alanine carboxypeptidase/D-alanyl-D-alanine-endopeptidase (penicillin-binding protein 4)
VVLLAAGLAAGNGAKDRLLYHAETLDGTVVASKGADRLFNPASVVKAATTLWALERLGSDHRYSTTVGFRGTWDRDQGVIDGQLVLEGGGDPDFHAENAMLVARQLNALGIRRVSDGLAVTGPFTIGWERGAERRLSDQRARAQMMAERLRRALDSNRWGRSERASWQAMCRRRGWEANQRPGVAIAGAATVVANAEYTPLVRHRSNPLKALLKRFNVYSNNDIIRVADGLGGTLELERFVRQRLGTSNGWVELDTASGEGRNRMNARLAVQLMRELRRTAEQLHLHPSDLLPVPGCDPGPVARMFPRLAWGTRARTVATKTGTLKTTDNGVAVLAGYFSSPDRGEVLFCVAAPDAGSSLWHWRSVEQAWLLDLMKRLGGATQMSCGSTLPYSDSLAEVKTIGP